MQVIYRQISHQVLSYFSTHLFLLVSACPDYHAPVLFQYPSSSGFTHHGLFFYPHGQEAGKKYPTVVMVYGGPQVQQVTNCFKGIRSVEVIGHRSNSCGFVNCVYKSQGLGWVMNCFLGKIVSQGHRSKSFLLRCALCA